MNRLTWPELMLLGLLTVAAIAAGSEYPALAAGFAATAALTARVQVRAARHADAQRRRDAVWERRAREARIREQLTAGEWL